MLESIDGLILTKAAIWKAKRFLKKKIKKKMQNDVQTMLV